MFNVKQWAAAVGLCLAVLPACSPRVIERVRTEYVTNDVHHRDTIITRDSVHIREWMRGDTVYVDRVRDRYVYRDRWRDSVRVVRDSLTVERVKEVKVQVPPSPWERAKLAAFPWVLGIAVGLGYWTFRKPLRGLITKIAKRIF